MKEQEEGIANRLKITKRTVDALKPDAKRYHAWDAELKGFGLRIEPTGRKAYIVKTRVQGEQRWLTIGEHGSPWTPEQARKKACELLSAVHVEGRDPAKEKQAAKAMLTIAELCDLYLRDGVGHKKPSTIKADHGRMEHHIKPLLGKVKADKLAKADVTKLFNAVRDGGTAAKKEGAQKRGRIVVVGGEGAAKQCIMLLSTLMSFAIERGFRGDNPAKGFKKPKGKKLQRFLSEAEIVRLGEALAAEEAANGNPYPTAAIKVLALTGARRGEIEKLRWQEVNFELGMLELSDSKTGGKPIYLNAPATAILSDLPRVAGNPYVFVGKEDGKHYNGLGKLWGRVRKAAGLDDVRLHDLRHSFASVGVGGNLSLPIIGALLGHRNASTTQRYAHLSADPLRKANEAVGARIGAALGIVAKKDVG